MIDTQLKEELKQYLKINYTEQNISIENDLDLAENGSFDLMFEAPESYNLDEYFNKQLKNFNDMLRQLIKDYNKANNSKDSDIYKKANISKEHFNKIINQKINPGKNSLIALGIALELDLDGVNKLLNAAGFALTNTNKFDLVIQFCLEKELYDIMTINELLFTNGINMLGYNK